MLEKSIIIWSWYIVMSQKRKLCNLLNSETSVVLKDSPARCQRLNPAILATQEAETKRMAV
jgi:hypothetical protein